MPTDLTESELQELNSLNAKLPAINNQFTEGGNEEPSVDLSEEELTELNALNSQLPTTKYSSTAVITQDNPEIIDADPELSAAAKINKSWDGAWGSVKGSFGAGLEWVGMENEMESLEQFGQELKEEGIRQQIANYQDLKEFEWSDLGTEDFWLTKAPSIIPSVLSLMGPSIVAGTAGAAAAEAAYLEVAAAFTPVALAEPTPIGEAALATGAVVSGVVGGIGGAVSATAVSRTLEGIMEAGGSYMEVINALKEERPDLSDSEVKTIASKAASEVFKRNYSLAGLDMVQFALAFAPIKGLGAAGKFASKMPKPLTISGRLGVGAATEGFEEGYQAWITQNAIARARGQNQISWDEFKELPETKEAVALGAIGGLFFQGLGEVGGSVMSKIKDKESKAEEKADEINSGIDLISRASTEEEAKKIQKEIARGVISGNVVEFGGENTKAKIEKKFKDGEIDEQTKNDALKLVDDVESVLSSLPEKTIKLVKKRVSSEVLLKKSIEEQIESIKKEGKEKGHDSDIIKAKTKTLEEKKRVIGQNIQDLISKEMEEESRKETIVQDNVESSVNEVLLNQLEKQLLEEESRENPSDQIIDDINKQIDSLKESIKIERGETSFPVVEEYTPVTDQEIESTENFHDRTALSKIKELQDQGEAHVLLKGETVPTMSGIKANQEQDQVAKRSEIKAGDVLDVSTDNPFIDPVTGQESETIHLFADGVRVGAVRENRTTNSGRVVGFLEKSDIYKAVKAGRKIKAVVTEHQKNKNGTTKSIKYQFIEQVEGPALQQAEEVKTEPVASEKVEEVKPQEEVKVAPKEQKPSRPRSEVVKDVRNAIEALEEAQKREASQEEIESLENNLTELQNELKNTRTAIKEDVQPTPAPISEVTATEEQAVEQTKEKTLVERIEEAISGLEKAFDSKKYDSINPVEVSHLLVSSKEEISAEEYSSFKSRIDKAFQSRHEAKTEINNNKIDKALSNDELIKQEIADDLGLDIDDVFFEKDIKQRSVNKILGFKNLNTIAKRLGQSFPNIGVYTNQESFDLVLEEIGFTGEKTPLGLVHNGEVYLNPSKATLETAIHEMGHIWSMVMRENNKELYDQGIELVKGTEYETRVKEEYPELTEEVDILEEALAQAIGDKGASVFEKATKNETFLSKFKEFLKDMYKSITEFFGFNSEVASGLEDVELSNFVNSVVDQMLEENPISLLSSEQLSKFQRLEAAQQKPVPDNLRKEAREQGRTKKEAVKETTSLILDRIKKALKEIAEPISTRVMKISPKIAKRLFAFEFNVARRNQNSSKIINKFLSKVRESGMTAEDQNELYYLLINQDINSAAKMMESFEGVTEAFENMQDMIEDMNQEAILLGLDFDEGYFPRVIKDPEGYLTFIENNAENIGSINRAIEEKNREFFSNLGREMNQDEKAEFIDSLVRKSKDALFAYSLTEEETASELDFISPEVMKFYYSMDEAVHVFSARMNNSIEGRKFLGGFGKLRSTDIKNIKAAINTMILQEEPSIEPSKQLELARILESRMAQGSPSNLVKTFKNVTYISVMGNPGSAITQIGDLVFSIYKNGLGRTLSQIPKAIRNKSLISKEALGIEGINTEFVSKSKSTFWVNRVFKAVGLEWMDRVGKEVFINATLDKMASEAKNPSPKLMDKLSKVLDPSEITQALEDLKEKKTESELVKRVLFVELSGVQPITPSEMPAAYLRSGNAKIMWMLKSFTIKQLDFMRREIFDELADGIKTNNKAKITRALTNLTIFAGVFVLMGMSTDELKDWLFDRDTKVSDSFADNLFKLAGLNKYTVNNVSRQGIASTATNFVLPPFNLFDDISKDIIKREFNKTAKHVPVAGKVYYYWTSK